MQMIMLSLAKEGFSAGQSSVDEVIRHLWWKREYSNSKLRLAEKAIKKMNGGDAKLALEVWESCMIDIYIWQTFTGMEARSFKIRG